MTEPKLKSLAIPRPSSGHLAALGEADRPIAVFSDFDGTIFLQDTGHVLFDKYGCGPERRQELDHSIGRGRTFREASEELWGSLNVTLDEAKGELRKSLVLDPDFVAFYDNLQAHNVEFTIISAGMKPLLRTALDAFVGPERSQKINIISNDGDVSADGKWTVKWLHSHSPQGIDKSLAIKDWIAVHETPKQPRPRIVFVGDGASDLPAAREADILFARHGLELERYCIEHMIPYIPYMRFKEVLHDVKLLIKDNRFHDPEAAQKFRQARIQQLTGGLGPLSKPTTTSFGFADSDNDDDDSSDGGDDDSAGASSAESEGLVTDIRRPHTPPYEPEFLQKPPLDRTFSTGDVTTVVK